MTVSGSCQLGFYQPHAFGTGTRPTVAKGRTHGLRDWWKIGGSTVMKPRRTEGGVSIELLVIQQTTTWKADVGIYLARQAGAWCNWPERWWCIWWYLKGDASSIRWQSIGPSFWRRSSALNCHDHWTLGRILEWYIHDDLEADVSSDTQCRLHDPGPPTPFILCVYLYII